MQTSSSVFLSSTSAKLLTPPKPIRVKSQLNSTTDQNKRRGLMEGAPNNKWAQKTISLSPQQRGCHLITPKILKEIEQDLSGFKCGLAHFFLQHTSASLTINENYDSDVRDDTETFLNKIVPEGRSAPWKHTLEGPDDMPAHIKSSMFGCTLTVPITDGRLNMGTWQGIWLCEHRDYATPRKIVVTLNGVCSLLRSHEEAHELVRFIDKNLNSVGLRNQNRSKFAEAVWRGVIFEISELSAGRGFSSLFPKIFESANDYTTLSYLDRALVIIKKLKTAMPSDIVSDEVGVITSIIGSREYSSIEDLSIFIEQMFVDMVHMFLARFPHAVFKEVTDSPAEEFDERIGLALHFVCQLKWLKAPIRWSFPAGCDISSLVDDQAHNAQNQVDSIEEPTTVENSISLHVTENVDNAFHITVDDEIVRVE